MIALSLALAGVVSVTTRPAVAFTGITDMSGLAPAQLVSNLLDSDSGITAHNITYIGAPVAAGTFTGGLDAIGIEAGVVMSTGTIAGVQGEYSFNADTSNGQGGDADLTALTGAATNDAAVLQFEFTPDSDQIQLLYVFGSEEYPEYVDQFNDGFAFFVNDVNYAKITRVDGMVVPVTINNINDKDATRNPQYYRDNTSGAYPLTLDGLTTILSLKAPVNPNVVNRIKIAIADAGDSSYDSVVFMKLQSLTAHAADLSLDMEASAHSPNIGDNVTFTLTANNAGPYIAHGVEVNDLLPPGLVYQSATGGGSYDPGTGTWSVGDLAVGGNASLSLVAQVTSTSTLENTAQVTESDRLDPDSTPNNGIDGEDDQKTARLGPNSRPSDITMSAQPVRDTDPAGTIAGYLTAVDPDPGDTATFSLTGDAGGRFTLDNNRVLVAPGASLTQDSYTISVQATDAGGLSLLAPKSFTISITLSNRPPTVSPWVKSGTEDTTLDLAASDFIGAYTDPDTDPLAQVQIVSLPLNGALRLDGVSVSAGQEIPAGDLGGLSFTPVENWNGSASFTWKASDGILYAASTATATLNISAVDDPPELSVSGTAAFLEDGAPVVVAPEISLTDPDEGATLSGVTVAINTGFEAGEDQLGLSGQPGPGTTAEGIDWSYDAAKGILTLSGTASPADYQAALRQVTYMNSSHTPSIAPRSLVFAISSSGLYNPANEHFYEFVEASEISWTQARDAAADRRFYGLHGYLTTITSQEENNFVAGKLAGFGWMGASDAETPDVWKWVTGPEAGTVFYTGRLNNLCGTPSTQSMTTPGYSAWAPNQPDHYQCTEDYGHFYTDGAWNDFPVSSEGILGYVAEYGGMPGDPTLQLTGATTLNVTAINDAPVIGGSDPVARSLDEDSSPTPFSLTLSATDLDGDPLGWSISANPAHGTAGAVNGVISYAPAAGYNGADAFTVTVSDGKGGSDSIAVNVTINPRNDAPVNLTPPALTGTPHVGVSLTAQPGSWDDTLDLAPGTLTLTYQWRVSSNADGSGSSPIPGATASIYTPQSEDNGRYLSVLETATDDGEGLPVTRAASAASAWAQVMNASPAIAEGDSLTVDMDEDASPQAFELALNASDSDGDALTWSITSSPAHGTAELSGAGGTRDITYTPAANTNGEDTFTVTVSDDYGGSDSILVRVTVRARNDAPVNTEAPWITGTPYTGVAVSASTGAWNDAVDRIPGTLSYTYQWWRSDNLDGSGAIAITGATGSTYTPAPSDHTHYLSVRVTASDDGEGLPASQSASAGSAWVQVLNTAPTIAEGAETAVTMDEDGSPQAFELSLTASDPDGDTLTWALASNPAHGTAEVTGAGATSGIAYTPRDNYSGEDSFAVDVSDSLGGSDTITVEVTLRPVNDPPAFASLPLTHATQDQMYTFAITATDPDQADPGGEALAITASGLPGWLTLTDLGGGQATLSGTPGSAAVGKFNVTLRVADPHEAGAALPFTLTVDNVNDAPTDLAVSGTTAAEGLPGVVVGNLSASDPDTGDSFSYSIQGEAGPFEISGSSLRLRSGQSLDYETRSSYPLTLRATDTGGLWFEQVVTITVLDRDEPPIDLLLAPAALSEHQPAGASAGTLSAVDLDAGDTATFSLVPRPASSDAALFAIEGDRLVTARRLDYEDQPTYHLRLRATSRSGAYIEKDFTLTLVDANDAPLAVDDMTTTRSWTVRVDALANDSDPDGDPLSIKTYDRASQNHGLVSLNPDGSLAYTVPAGFRGSDRFSYTLMDEHGATGQASVIVVVDPAPVEAADDQAMTLEGATLVVDALANDGSPSGLSLSLAITTPPEHGTAEVLSNRITYTPKAGFSGEDSLVYSATDGLGTGSAAVTITILAVNAAPVGHDDSAVTPEGTPVTVNVLANDSDRESQPLALVSFTQAEHGRVAPAAGGGLRYIPEAAFEGADRFIYTLQDTAGATDEAAVTIQVTHVNHAPRAVDDTAATSAETPVRVAILANDSDPDGEALQAAMVGGPAHGAAQVNPDGSLTYTPAAGYSGADQLAYRLSDGQGGEDLAVVDLTVSVEEAPPLAVADAGVTVLDTPLTLTVLANDRDPSGRALKVEIASQGAHGSVYLNPDGSLRYTPELGYTGVDTFSYALHAGEGESAPTNTAMALVTVIVAPQGGAVQAVDDSHAATQGAPVYLDVLENDSPAGEVSLLTVTQPAHGRVTLDGEQVLYASDPDFTGMDTFTYLAGDEALTPATATVSVTVAAAGLRPAAISDQASTLEGQPVEIHVLDNDLAPAGRTLEVESAGQGYAGTVVAGMDGGLTYTPADGFHGSDAFTYTIGDGLGGTASTVVEVEVTATNHLPEPQDDLALATAGQVATIEVLKNDADPDGDTLSLSSVGTAGHGSLASGPGGTVTYTPDPDYAGADSFSYRVTDGNGQEAEATVSVRVNPASELPVAGDDSASIKQGEASRVDVLANDITPPGEHLYVIGVSLAGHGYAGALGGAVFYQPDDGYFGEDTFTYTVSDEFGRTATAQVTIRVTHLYKIILPFVRN